MLYLSFLPVFLLLLLVLLVDRCPSCQPLIITSVSDRWLYQGEEGGGRAKADGPRHNGQVPPLATFATCLPIFHRKRRIKMNFQIVNVLSLFGKLLDQLGKTGQY